MTTPPTPALLARCPHGNEGKLDAFNTIATMRGVRCGCFVTAPTEASALAAWSALCDPHAMAAAEKREAARRVECPTVPGWYWATHTCLHERMIVQVELVVRDTAKLRRGELIARMVARSQWLGLDVFTDWYGPLLAPAGEDGAGR